MRPRRVNRAGTHTVGANAVFRLFNRHAFGESVNPTFRAAIRRVLSQAEHSRFAACRDDVAARFLQFGHGKARHQKHRADVFGHGFINGVNGILIHFAGREKHARVVDKNVETAERINGGLNATLRVMWVGDVADISDDLAAFGFDGFDDIQNRVARQAVDDHARAFLRELVGDGFANSRSATGHDGDFLF